VSFPESISTCFRKYAVFRGRASRPEFWWFVLLYYAIIFVPVFVAVASDPDAFEQASSNDEVPTALALIIFGGFLSLLLPYLAAGVRRLHDTGKSGWWWFINLIPFGSIVLIIFLATEGDRVSNRYGPPPGVPMPVPAPPGAIPPGAIPPPPSPPPT
jgi:uncharacterized membrane protein YhaH (DUF805 family)